MKRVIRNEHVERLIALCDRYYVDDDVTNAMLRDHAMIAIAHIEDNDDELKCYVRELVDSIDTLNHVSDETIDMISYAS